MTPTRPIASCLALATLLLAGACVPDDGRPDQAAATFLELTRAELARPTDGILLERLIDGTEHADPFLRRTAVRALGRLEDPARISDILPHLEDPTPTVRVAAVNALAQAVHRSDGSQVLDALEGLTRVETDPNVRAVLGQSLGRLTLDDEAQARVVEALLDMAGAEGQDSPPSTMLGLAMGLESVARRTRGAALGERAFGRLTNLLTYDLMDMRDGLNGPRVRLLALSALGASGRLSGSVMEPTLRDPDPRVRAVAAGFLGAVSPVVRGEFIRRGLGDPSVRVRIATVRQLAREDRTPLVCDWLTQVATQDEVQGVRVLAIDGLGVPCPDAEAQTTTLLGAVSLLGPETLDGWQVPAHALVSLALLSPELAESRLDAFVGHASPFVRTYAATSAEVLGREDVLRSLLDDEAANVRTAALTALAARGVPDAGDLAAAQLANDDPQLLMTAARILSDPATARSAAEEALAAFERISSARRDTWRDSRSALLELIAEQGGLSLSDRLSPFLQDYDAVIASRVAELISEWTGSAVQAAPRPLPALALPSSRELRELAETRVTLHMRSGGSIVIEPLPFLAPSNAFRFVRLAREGYFDGLTFHRWVPNFVIQGGSPGANEYSGAGRYSRDEVGLLPHWRGTVGLSTRGHDTGDAQIFINIIDNVRLNHDYTIYAVVETGIDVVDRVLEGDVIARAEVTRLP